MTRRMSSPRHSHTLRVYDSTISGGPFISSITCVWSHPRRDFIHLTELESPFSGLVHGNRRDCGVVKAPTVGDGPDMATVDVVLDNRRFSRYDGLKIEDRENVVEVAHFN